MEQGHYEKYNWDLCKKCIIDIVVNGYKSPGGGDLWEGKKFILAFTR